MEGGHRPIESISDTYPFLLSSDCPCDQAVSVRALRRMGLLDSAHVRVKGEDLLVPVDLLAMDGLRLLLVTVSVQGYAGGLSASRDVRRLYGACLAAESQDEPSSFLCTDRIRCERRARVELLDTVKLPAFRSGLDLLNESMGRPEHHLATGR
jgi:hypothetical protein